ncbi:MAG TPA: hypothetical protein VIV55_09840 [Flavobacterium sp.]
MTLTTTLENTQTSELLRAYNSNKEYLFFDISVFNAGASIHIKCTDNYKEINRNTWNGYDFILENDSTTKYYILSTLKDRLLYKEGHILSDKEIKKINQIINQ